MWGLHVQPKWGPHMDNLGGHFLDIIWSLYIASGVCTIVVLCLFFIINLYYESLGTWMSFILLILGFLENFMYSLGREKVLKGRSRHNFL